MLIVFPVSVADRGAERLVKVHPPIVTDLFEQLSRSPEFTVWANIRQDQGSGSIFTIMDTRTNIR